MLTHRHKSEKMLMHRGVVCQFRMKGGRHNIVTLHQRGLSGILRENLQVRAGSLNDRAANEDHFQGLLLQFRWPVDHVAGDLPPIDRKSTRLNSSHSQISYAVFCLKKKQTAQAIDLDR